VTLDSTVFSFPSRPGSWPFWGARDGGQTRREVLIVQKQTEGWVGNMHEIRELNLIHANAAGNSHLG
jgi:hypothetical protein